MPFVLSCVFVYVLAWANTALTGLGVSCCSRWAGGTHPCPVPTPAVRPPAGVRAEGVIGSTRGYAGTWDWLHLSLSRVEEQGGQYQQLVRMRNQD